MRMKMRHHIALIALVSATLPFSYPAFAQFTQQGPKLLGTGAVGVAWQGTSVSLSADGNTAIVGGFVAWLRPDAKTQVSVRYLGGRPVQVDTVLVSTQHSSAVSQPGIEAFVREDLLPRALGEWFRREIAVIANPSGSFIVGGPSADAGVTGRKIIVDTYGGFARHGGGAFSGKDPSKVDRSGAYFCRWVARKIVDSGLARRAEVQVSYAIGRAEPVSTMVETFGTGDEAAAKRFVDQQDFSPASITKQLDLLQPIYARTTNYGHFGRPGLPWES